MLLDTTVFLKQKNRCPHSLHPVVQPQLFEWIGASQMMVSCDADIVSQLDIANKSANFMKFMWFSTE